MWVVIVSYSALGVLHHSEKGSGGLRHVAVVIQNPYIPVSVVTTGTLCIGSKCHETSVAATQFAPFICHIGSADCLSLA